jgi:hypothetical protein
VNQNTDEKRHERNGSKREMSRNHVEFYSNLGIDYDLLPFGC